MATEDRIEVPEGGDCTPAERKVSHVYVVKAARGWAKIECSARKDAIDEVTPEVWVCFEEGAEVANVVRV
jgi:hypothetical protein